MQAEEFAVKYIIGLGKQVIERNYKRAGGEIDIIYKDGDILVFCEVKARSRADYGRAEEFVNYDKKEKSVSYTHLNEPALKRLNIISEQPANSILRLRSLSLNDL